MSHKNVLSFLKQLYPVICLGVAEENKRKLAYSEETTTFASSPDNEKLCYAQASLTIILETKPSQQAIFEN
jgi:hypothetical protein